MRGQLAGLSFPPVQEWGLPRASLLLAFAAVGYSIQSPLCSLSQPPTQKAEQGSLAWPLCLSREFTAPPAALEGEEMGPVGLFTGS